MKIDLHFGKGVLTLPAAALDRIAGAGESELKILLALGDPILREGFDPAELAQKLGLSMEQTLCAIEFWRGAGLLSKTDGGRVQPAAVQKVPEVAQAKPEAPKPADSPKPDTVPTKNGVSVTIVRSDDGMPHYTVDEINRIFAENGQLSGLIDECQNVFGKIFNPTEINRLMALNDYFKLDCEYILLLAYYCKKIGKASIPYLDKLARSLYNEGIDHVDSLSERLGEMEAAADLGNYYRTLTGMGKRVFTEKENRFVTQWVKWNIAPEVLKIAYEIAVNQTGAPSMPYTNKVLANWKEAGYTTAEQVQRAIEEYKAKKEGKNVPMGAAPANTSFATDEFFEAALKRSLAVYESTQNS